MAHHDLEHVRRIFRGFSLLENLGPNDRGTIGEINRELNDVRTIEELKNRPRFIEIMALFVILTCPFGERLYDIHEGISRFFFQLINANPEDMTSKSHFGRLLFRKYTNGHNISGPEGNEPSHYLWQHLHSSVATEIPDHYPNDCAAALIYLLLTELTKSFRMSSFDAIEIPGLLELMSISEANNLNNFGAIIGEYLGLVGVCFHEHYTHPNYKAKSEVVDFDFSILRNARRICYFNVKSICFLGTQYFGTWRTNSEVKKFVTGEHEANVLLHDCDCPFCDRNPIWKVEVKLQVSDDGDDTEENENSSNTFKGLGDEFECTRKGDFSRMITPLSFGTVYLVSARLFYDIRYLLSEFDQSVYTGQHFALGKHLRDVFVEGLPLAGHDKGGQMSTLRVRRMD